MEAEPIRRGPALTLRELEAAFGPCAGMVLGYGEGEFGEDGGMRWCAALLPNDAMPRFVAKRHAAGLRGPFLIGLGSLKRAAARGGSGEALYGFALAADASWPARELLHPDQMARPENLNERGEFRWQNGVPLLRVWLCWPPLPFADLTGRPPRFQQHHGIRVVPLGDVAGGLHAAAPGVPLREAVLERPKPLPEPLWRPLRVREGGLRLRTVGERERSPEAKRAALLANHARFGAYTCEDCGYRPGRDPRVPEGSARRMLDVHHVEPLAGGERDTTLDGLAVLCPLCHRRHHVAQRTPTLASGHGDAVATDV